MLVWTGAVAMQKNRVERKALKVKGEVSRGTAGKGCTQDIDHVTQEVAKSPLRS